MAGSNARKGSETMKKLKLYAAFILTLLAIILFFQNREPMETKLLFVTVVMPRAALLFITMLIGIATGILISLSLSGKRLKIDAKYQDKNASDS
jgi:uncharacterized integral membrane protein